ncbi:MAG: RHS repeat-associated core domain-containing protein, partial [Sphingobacteriia bacterium]
GNVLSVVTDNHLPVYVGGVLDHYVAQVVQAQDYTAFGAAMEGRSFSISSYRFGFQGMEKEDNLYGDGNAYTTQYRMLDVRIGRWFSTDPVVQPWMSPYSAFDNNPIFLVDPLGLKARDASGTVRNGDYKNFWDVLKHRSPKETLKVWGNAVKGLFSGGGGDTRRLNKMLGSRGRSAADENYVP